MPAILTRYVLALLATGGLSLVLAGCGRESCEANGCVESCGGPAFLSCGSCPTGSFAEEACAPPTADTTCVAGHDRPEGTCDDSSCAMVGATNGRCVATPGETDFCSGDSCTTSADCTSGTVCACNAGPLGAHVCVPAACTSSADCGGLACRPILGCYVAGGGAAGVGILGYRCATAGDTCATDADCAGPGERCTVADPMEPVGFAFRCLVTTCE